MQIKHYPWQEQQWQYLLNRAKQESLPHALLLQGMSGLGKLAFAKAYALMLLCSQGVALSRACGKCPDCRWGLSNHHPDLMIIQPENKQIRIEQIRRIIHHASQTAAKYRIIILEPVEHLHPAAANALLKILEEPLGKAVFLLVNHQSSALLPTIKSRCQRLNFYPNQDSREWIKMQIAEHAKLLSLLAEDSPLKALELQSEINDILQLLTDLLALRLKQKNCLQLAAKWLNKDLNRFLNMLIIWINYLIMYKSKLTLSREMPESIIQQICHKVSLRALFSYSDRLYQAKAYLQQSVNTQLFLEDIFHSWITLE